MSQSNAFTKTFQALGQSGQNLLSQVFSAGDRSVSMPPIDAKHMVIREGKPENRTLGLSAGAMSRLYREGNRF